MLSKAASSSIFWVFDMTRPGIEPGSPIPFGEHCTHSANGPVYFSLWRYKLILYIGIYINCIMNILNVIWYRTHTSSFRWCLRGVMLKAQHNGIVVSEFELQSRYYVHFLTNTIGESYEPSYLPSYELNSPTTVLLEGWIWHWVTSWKFKCHYTKNNHILCTRNKFHYTLRCDSRVEPTPTNKKSQYFRQTN